MARRRADDMKDVALMIRKVVKPRTRHQQVPFATHPNPALTFALDLHDLEPLARRQMKCGIVREPEVQHATPFRLAVIPGHHVHAFHDFDREWQPHGPRYLRKRHRTCAQPGRSREDDPLSHVAAIVQHVVMDRV